MRGTYSVEDFLAWLRSNENIPLVTRVHLSKKVKRLADQASSSGRWGRLDIKQMGKTVFSIRIFEDGSCELGWPDDLRWYGTKKPPLVPQEEKEP